MKSRITITTMSLALTAFLTAGLASPAVAAPCSKTDKAAWKKLDFNHIMAYIDPTDEKVDKVYNTLDSWKKTTKSAKIKSALAAYEKQVDIASGGGYMWKSYPKLAASLATIRSTVNRNRC